MSFIKSKNISHINKKVFKDIFDGNFNALCGYGNKYVSDLFVVEDIVQETFIGFWNKKDDFQHIDAIKSFLYTSVRNKCINHLKHQKVLQKFEGTKKSEEEIEQEDTHFIIEEETFNQLYQEIKNLPMASQEVMLLALSGMKNQEIADELTISINTVKTQKKIAYGKLKTKLGPSFQVLLMTILIQ